MSKISIIQVISILPQVGATLGRLSFLESSEMYCCGARELFTSS